MSKLATYDITISKEVKDTHTEVIEFLEGWCKKWVFQLEQSEKGYIHWQVRVSLIKTMEFTTVKRRCQKGELVGHWTPTSENTHDGNNFNYVMKCDTRIDGPWDSKTWRENIPPPLTRQLKAFQACEWYPWQRKVYDMIQETDDRTIHMIWDTHGNLGKSVFCEHLEYKGEAIEVEPFNAIEDIMGCVIDQKIAKAYCIDMPKGMKKDKLGAFYAGLEVLKNGKAYDKRYKFRKIRFDRPQVIVFTNTLPDFGLMSKDRWKVWKVTEVRDLEFFSVDSLLGKRKRDASEAQAVDDVNVSEC